MPSSRDDARIESAAAEIIVAACNQQRIREQIVHGLATSADLLEAERTLARATYAYRRLQGERA